MNSIACIVINTGLVFEKSKRKTVKNIDSTPKTYILANYCPSVENQFSYKNYKV
jgi:hypothetical protein